MRPLRRLMSQLEYGSLPPAITGRNKEAAIGPITVEDVEAAKNATKPSAVLHLDRYEKWTSIYGSSL